MTHLQDALDLCNRVFGPDVESSLDAAREALAAGDTAIAALVLGMSVEAVEQVSGA